MKKNILLLFIFLVFSVPAVADEGDDAYNRGDYATAYRIFKKRAEAGESYAQVYLGYMYDTGSGVSQSDRQAVYWYRKAAEQGHSTGQKNLGVMYENGRGVPQDYYEAVHWYRKAAEQGNGDGQANLGHMYSNGLGVVQDYDKAVFWYRKSADQGNSYGQVNLGYMYDMGRGVPQDYEKAVHWYRKSAEQGNSTGQKNLGYMYENGRGVAQDYNQAVYWYRKAAEQGNTDAQVNLGYMYDYGYGVAQDDDQAVYWYRKAAEQGNSWGENNLGYMYEVGRGVSQDTNKAMEWYQKSAEQGNKLGVENLQKLLAKLGFDPGPADGKFGTQTQTALTQYHASLDSGASGLRLDADKLLSKLPREKTLYRSPSSALSLVAGAQVEDVTFGNYYALVIGNEGYRHFKPLRSAIDDARAVAELLRTKYGFKVTPLEDATRSDIMRELGKLRQLLTKTDNLLIYYAGHGSIDSITKRGYWHPVDAEPGNRANWIATDDITNELQAMTARHVLVVADSCYSGKLVRTTYDEIETGGMEEWIRRMNRNRSRTALTSGGLEPVMDQGGGRHSVFAASFIKTLRENKRIIHMDSLFDKIKYRVSLNARQTPDYGAIRYSGHEEGDFILVPR